MKRSALYPGPGMISDYHDWYDAASHGDVLTYYTGDLQYDRQCEYNEFDPDQKYDWARTVTLNAVADSISYEAKKGNLVLTQRKLAESNYEYIATKINRQEAVKSQAKKQSDAVRIR